MRGLPLVAASGGHSSSRCAGLSLSQPLPLWSTGSRRAGSVVVAHGLSCSAACGIFPDQGSNPCPLHSQADSQPLRHQGSPRADTFKMRPQYRGICHPVIHEDIYLSLYSCFTYIRKIFVLFYNKNNSSKFHIKNYTGASLVVQWFRVCLPMQGTRVRAPVWEDPTCRGATGPVSHNC